MTPRTLALAASLALALACSRAGTADRPRRVEMTVTKNGFDPAVVPVARGETLALVITRQTDDTCATEIVIPSHGIKAELPLLKPVTVTLTARDAGTIRYSCAMGMLSGVIEVR